ncbi:YibE/F family protein [Lysinibacillus cavernae]|uniref:YibE/F family protein n=1 Tax=Lysinibacillus cavernae TaxID=2666135 RepID=UPI0012D94EC7|nr:YibE/F family protein [Lysinibacillus cavernae]
MQFFKNITVKQGILTTLLVFCSVISIVFVHHNEQFYDRPIAEVIKADVAESEPMTDMYDNDDYLFTQHLTAVIKNGQYKGQSIQLTNDYSSSGAFDQEYHVGNEIFVSINNQATPSVLTGSILDLKRDQTIIIIAWIFIFGLLIIGKRQGLFSIVSLVVNALILSFALDLYVEHGSLSLLLIIGVCVLLFTIISLLLISGLNTKTYAAIISTLLGTVIALIISSVVMWITGENGLRYEEMQFLTRPYRTIFMAGLFIGSLGAVMDVSITMASSIFALYEQDPTISVKALKSSGVEIGRDIMGTITSILFFAYLCGSIPMVILYLKNSSPLGLTLSLNLSLELARALAGGIGVVLTIPISQYTALFFINRKRVKA